MDDNIIKLELILQNSGYNNSKSNLWDCMLKVINEMYIEQFKIGYSRPSEEKDFVENRKFIERRITCLERIYKTMSEGVFISDRCLDTDLHSHITIGTLLICGEHSEKKPWTTEITLAMSSFIVQHLCNIYFCDNIGELCQNNFSLLQQIFFKLKPKLLKETFKLYPAAVTSYYWIVLNLKSQLGELMHLVMPTVFVLFDDYDISNRIIALRCLEHITRNVSTFELNRYCDINGLIKILKKMMYNLEPEIVEPLLSCIVTVINKELGDKYRHTWNHFDDVMSIWLPTIEMEQVLVLRVVYMESLLVLLQSMGLSCVRWSHRLISIFEDYAVTPDDMENCFKVMHTFISMTWPRTSKYFDQLIVIILKSLTDLTDDKNIVLNESKKSDSISEIIKCLNLLNEIVPDKMEKLICDILSNDNFSENFKSHFIALNK